jgi:hypothetical protein
MKNPTWNEIPCILAEINMGIWSILELLQGGAAAVQPDTPTAQEPEQPTAPAEDAPTAPEPEQHSHDSLKKLCLSLNRANAENKTIITGLIARYTTGKLADVHAEKLPDLHAAIMQECIHG